MGQDRGTARSRAGTPSPRQPCATSCTASTARSRRRCSPPVARAAAASWSTPRQPRRPGAEVHPGHVRRHAQSARGRLPDRVGRGAAFGQPGAGRARAESLRRAGRSCAPCIPAGDSRVTSGSGAARGLAHRGRGCRPECRDEDPGVGPVGLLVARIDSCGGAGAGGPGVELIRGEYTRGSSPTATAYRCRHRRGLILVDTGATRRTRSACSTGARAPDRLIRAVVTTHWHLDPWAAIRACGPRFRPVRVYASAAIDAALDGFLADYRR